MRIKKSLLAFIGLLFLCVVTISLTLAANTGDPTPQLRPTTLSREAAAQRSKQLSHISYTLWFGLEADRAHFEGRTVIRFDLKPKAKDLGKTVFLDLEEGSIRSISVNGVQVTDLSRTERFDGHHIYFQTSELHPTANRIEVSYTHPFSSNGNGLHRFKDPVDEKVYLYSNFEPYNAHRMFPCFDQPDLKASYELTVEAPKDWTVISNTLERETNNVDGRKSWAFPPSPLLSTYVFALHAGPYAVWKSNADGIPMRLFSRKSLSKYIDYREWFEVTKQGLDFYGTQFGFPYPFAKYDQIIVPDFNAGAMENAGAVTFSERFVFRTKVTNDRHRRRADTILHEMAHMWFGDLVTMRWWNGLWLNESFATFMSAWAVDQATNYTGSWQSFFANVKQWAYWEDQLVTTHPIELPVADTENAEANFDGITYGKGASSIKQLSFYLGEDDFREGLQRYFQKYAFRNTSIGDFIKMLSEASSQDLAQWQHLWLQTAGVNTVKAVWECSTDPETEKSKISKFQLLQTDSDLRPHRTQIALFQFPKGQNRSTAPLTAGKTINLTYSAGATPVTEALGKPCPDFVFPNYRDYDYVKVELDSITLKQVSVSLARIEDSFSRQMLWHTLWEMVIDGKLRAQDYAEIVLHQGGQEKNTQILSKILRTLAEPSSNRGSVLKFLPPDLRKEYQAKIESFIKTRLNTAPAGSDLQLVWYQAFLDTAASHASVHFAKALLEKKEKLKGFEVDQEHRWELIQALSRNGSIGAKDLIHDELQNDMTDMGQKSAIAAEASIPDTEIKNQWLNRITRMNKGATPTSLPTPSPLPSPSGLAGTEPAPEKMKSLSMEDLPLAKLREAMWNYHILGQETFTKSSADIYFEKLPQIALSPSIEDGEYSKWFARAMFPSLCDPDIVHRTTTLLNAHPDLPAQVIKSLKVNRQEEERCIRAREKALSDSKDL